MQASIVDKDKRFKFTCRKCGFCCDNTIIYLYPFDIYNICKALNMTTQELHKNNFTKFLIDKEGIPRCILNNRPGCRFKSRNLCEIYDLRPLRCRLFPVGRYFEKDKVEYLLPSQRCIGFDSKKRQSIQEYLEKQETEQFDELALRWNNFIISIKQTPIKNKMFPVIFRKVFYDFDDRLIKEYREKLRKEDSLDEFMDNLYDISKTLFENVDNMH